MGSLAPVPPGKPYPPQGPTLMKSRDFRKIQIFNFSWKLGGPDSHERSRSIPSLLTLFGCASGSHCSPIPHQPLLLGPWRQWSLQPPPWRLAPYSGGCSVWPLILQMKEVTPKWSETSLIGGRGDHRAPPVTQIPDALLFSPRCSTFLRCCVNPGSCQGGWKQHLRDLPSLLSLAGLLFGMATPYPRVLNFQTTVKLCSSFSVLKVREGCNIFPTKRLTFNKKL